METKTYNINDKEFRLKKEFTIDDWDKSKKLDQYYGQMTSGKDANELSNNLTKEEFAELLWCALEPVDGNEVDANFFLSCPMQNGFKVYCDFFFVYLKLNSDMQSISTNFGKRAEKFTKKSETQKVN